MDNVTKENVYVLGLSKSIAKVFPAFKGERRDAKIAFIKGISLALRVSNHNRHYSEHTSGWVVRNQSLIQAGVDPRTWHKMIIKYPVFIIESDYWNFEQGIAKRYQPTEELMWILDFYNKTLSPDIFLMEMGSKSKFKLLDSVGSCLSPDDYDYFCMANVDTNELEEYSRKMPSMADYTISDTVGLRMMIALAKKGGGVLEQGYLACKTGRLVSRGVGSVQNMRKEIRNKAFKGFWDIDFENCHYSILNHLYDDSFIEAYVDSTYSFRNRIAEDLDISIPVVKKLLLAILYGCSISLKGNGAVVTELGVHKGKEFLEHHNVKGIIDAVDEAISYLESEGYFDTIMEEHGVPAKKALAYLIQSIESEILNYCVSLHTPEALFYDGFVTQEDVDTENLEKKVLEDLGYDIRITKELLGEWNE